MHSLWWLKDEFAINFDAACILDMLQFGVIVWPVDGKPYLRGVCGRHKHFCQGFITRP
ncbi:MAG: hypothetical protein OXC44_05125 [Proteobacteria bacterium]|nr:hypothetical protein [Pseudomonadota bacterium]